MSLATLPLPAPSYATRDADLGWHALPRVARLYVAAVIAIGIAALAVFVPGTYPRPWLFAGLLVAACLSSTWKVNLPIPLASSATLSVSHSANLMALLLLGPGHAVVIAVAGAWIQCAVNVSRQYPWYRTAFSVAGEAVTMAATCLVYAYLGGTSGTGTVFATVPIAAAIATYFVVNTGLVAAAIALSTDRHVWKVWRDDFLWSGMSFMVAGGAGAAAAMVIARGEPWKAALIAVPVYVTYRTYRLFVRRLANETTLTSGVLAVLSNRVTDAQKQYREAVEVLLETQMSERELASERERLARTIANLMHVQELHDQALEREQTARATAERANQLKDQFLATVSHELRTPLNAILGWAEMLRSGSLEDARRDRACLAIYTSARHQAALVNELLDVARIVSGKLPLQLGAVDLKDVVRVALEAVQAAADAKRIDVAVDDDPSLEVVYGDASRLQQVASNLLANAVKFTPQGGAIHVRLRRVGDMAELIVTDTGEGIPIDFLPAVFEPFRQADGSTTRRHGGLGLGLAIVKHLVDAHHGTVSADSGGEGRGATFTVRLPIAARHGVCVPAVAADSAPVRDVTDDGLSLTGISVLVVDDDDESRQVMAAHLDSHGAAVLMAASAAEALSLLQRERIDVLLADVGMPDEDGYALIRQLRALASPAIASIPAAAVTAFAGREDERQALEAGFNLHLAKPVEARSIVAAVARLTTSDV
jgi:signal transduction histidine kinase/ActR/RegA family two-component response regulator